jgi:REP element-mobilizing transposase RayT
MRRLEKVAGVQVLTYCFMDNHIHLLLRTEEVNHDSLSDGELVKRMRAMYSRALAEELESQLKRWRKREKAVGIMKGGKGSSNCGSGARASSMHAYWRERYLSRLGNLSEFMRVLKTSFSKWYNKEHRRSGTLWEDRYKVVLVEGSERVLVKVAAYIDLNPVRAGMVRDPGDYAWSGYGEALKGGSEARRGLVRVTGASAGRGWREAGPAYRQLLYFEGVEKGAPGTRVEVMRNRRGEEIQRAGIGREEARKVLVREGKLSLRELLGKRARYLVDGAVIGSREFVDTIFHAQPTEKKGKRKTGARKMRGGDWGEEGLYSLRDLRKDVFGKSEH